MQNYDTSLFPIKVQEKISAALPYLSENGKEVLKGLLQDGSILLDEGVQQASKNNGNFREKIMNFLIRRKKEIIKDMEQAERKEELEVDIDLSQI